MSDQRPDPFDLYAKVIERGPHLDELPVLDPLEQAIEEGLRLIAEAGEVVWMPGERAP